jgi:hypothetical protein
MAIGEWCFIATVAVSKEALSGWNGGSRDPRITADICDDMSADVSVSDGRKAAPATSLWSALA